jgi:hypothetical protein
VTLTATPDDLVSCIADSLRSQWRKILDHGGGLAITALDPVVLDVARNIAQGLMVFDDELTRLERTQIDTEQMEVFDHAR